MQSVGELIERNRIYEETKRKLKEQKKKEKKEKLKKALGSIGKELKKSKINVRKLKTIRLKKIRYDGIPKGRNIYDFSGGKNG